jgi:hypothetical protein
MAKTTYDFEKDPSQALYSDLITFALGLSQLALLVFRPEMDLTANGQAVLNSLTPYLESKEKSARWPGTEIFGSEAYLFYFRLTLGSAHILQTATDHLFGWHQPDLPEDLCFFRQDRTPWLVTIAHESDAYLSLTDQELQQLSRALPELRITSSE